MAALKKLTARAELAGRIRFVISTTPFEVDSYGDPDLEPLVEALMAELVDNPRMGNLLMLDGAVYRVIKGVVLPDPELDDEEQAETGGVYIGIIREARA